MTDLQGIKRAVNEMVENIFTVDDFVVPCFPEEYVFCHAFSFSEHLASAHPLRPPFCLLPLAALYF